MAGDGSRDHAAAGRPRTRRHAPRPRARCSAGSPPTGSSSQPRAASSCSTDAGRAAADAIFRRHALLEWLLTAVVGLGWAESDEEAARLQGAISPRVEARLDELLGHPQTCPHGNPIDAETARRRPAGHAASSEVEAGQHATIYRITEEAEEDAGAAVVPRGAGADPGRARDDPRPLGVARLAHARGAARPGHARPAAGGPRPRPARRGRPGAVPPRPGRRWRRRRLATTVPRS